MVPFFLGTITVGTLGRLKRPFKLAHTVSQYRHATACRVEVSLVVHLLSQLMEWSISSVHSKLDHKMFDLIPFVIPSQNLVIAVLLLGPAR